MSILVDVIMTGLVLFCAIIIFRAICISNNKGNRGSYAHLANSNQCEGEDHFGLLMSQITPPFYWRVQDEYKDFVYATIKKMTVDEVVSQPELFIAQRRCSDLNSAVYRYYDNIKKRCADGEKVSTSDIEVINLRQCFIELSCKAYPALVALIWPECQCPPMKTENMMDLKQIIRPE